MARTEVDRLLASDEPSIRWRVRTAVLGEDPQSRPLRRLREEIRRSARVQSLLDGHAELSPRTYEQWRGGHWVLLALAELGYPPGDEALVPLRDRVLRNWLAPRYLNEVDLTGSPVGHGGRIRPGQRPAVPVVAGRHRRCGSQQGGPLLAVVRLGLADERADQLARLLQRWQWPDGGWNCDLRPAAATSSVYETLLPMRALAAYAQARPDTRTETRTEARPGDGGEAAAAAERAVEVLLTRRLVFRRSTGRVIRSEWTLLHYPVYWHYDVLAGLKGLAEVGRITDERCVDALDLLQRKALPGGGWPAEASYYGRPATPDHVHWGGTDPTRPNDWVTTDALTVFAAADRPLNSR